jgi:hypothetical protein
VLVSVLEGIFSTPFRECFYPLFQEIAYLYTVLLERKGNVKLGAASPRVELVQHNKVPCRQSLTLNNPLTDAGGGFRLREEEPCFPSAQIELESRPEVQLPISPQTSLRLVRDK